MICGSKSGYWARYPDHIVVFNANIVIGKKKVWYGDVDLTIDKEKIDAIARECKEKVFVLREMDGRFENEKKPIIKNAVYVAEPK